MHRRSILPFALKSAVPYSIYCWVHSTQCRRIDKNCVIYALNVYHPLSREENNINISPWRTVFIAVELVVKPKDMIFVHSVISSLKILVKEYSSRVAVIMLLLLLLWHCCIRKGSLNLIEQLQHVQRFSTTKRTTSLHLIVCGLHKQSKLMQRRRKRSDVGSCMKGKNKFWISTFSRTRVRILDDCYIFICCCL